MSDTVQSGSQQRVGSRTGAAHEPGVERDAGAEPGDFPCRLHRSIYQKSDDPEHADNRDSREFLDGYAEGFSCNRANGLDGIADEWERRGCPEEMPAGFLEWKRGYNAGSMRRSWEAGAGESGNATKPCHSATVGTERA